MTPSSVRISVILHVRLNLRVILQDIPRDRIDTITFYNPIRVFFWGEMPVPICPFRSVDIFFRIHVLNVSCGGDHTKPSNLYR